MIHISGPQSDKRATVIEGTKAKSLEETVGVELEGAHGSYRVELAERESKHLEEPSQPIPIIKARVDPGREEGAYTLPSDYIFTTPWPGKSSVDGTNAVVLKKRC